MVRNRVLLGLALMVPAQLCSAASFQIGTAPAGKNPSVELAGSHGVAPILIDAGDYRVVRLAADMLADDVARVTGKRPAVGRKQGGHDLILAGTLGHSALIDRLAAAGKLRDLNLIRGKWEATVTQIVDNPMPGVRRALVIVGSDRRGTAYGLTQLSEKIGVSPWNWWADVPVAHRASLFCLQRRHRPAWIGPPSNIAASSSTMRIGGSAAGPATHSIRNAAISVRRPMPGSTISCCACGSTISGRRCTA